MFKENRSSKSKEKISEKLSKFPSSAASTGEGIILVGKQNSICEFESPSQSKKRFRSSPDSSLSEFDIDKTYTGIPKTSRRRSPLKERKSKRARPILPAPTSSKDQNTSFTSQLNISSFESSQRKRPEENSRRSRSAEASSKDDKIVTLATLNRSRSESPKHKRPGINSRLSHSEETGSKGDEIVTLASLTALIKTVHNSLSSKIDRFYGAQVEMSGKIDKLTDISQQKCRIESEDEIEENNLILLPVGTKEVFDIFDVRLKDDKEYCCKIKNRIKNMIPRNKTYETHTLSIILRTFLTKDLVRSSFTALQKTTDKVPLKETNFYKCLLDVHLKILGDAMDEEKFKGALKGSLNAAKDWEGGRALRRG